MLSDALALDKLNISLVRLLKFWVILAVNSHASPPRDASQDHERTYQIESTRLFDRMAVPAFYYFSTGMDERWSMLRYQNDCEASRRMQELRC